MLREAPAPSRGCLLKIFNENKGILDEKRNNQEN